MTAIKARAPFKHNGTSISQLMLTLMCALVPGILTSVWFFGYGILLNIALAMMFAIVSEAAMLRLRQRDLRLHLSDMSAVVTALLFAVALPPGSPWWLVALGILFAIVIVKHTYGGLGQNPFNPAMGAYAMLLLAFPLEMTNWHIPNTVITGPLTLDSIALPAEASEPELLNPLGWTAFKQSLYLSFPFAAPNAIDFGAFADGLAKATPLIEFKLAAKNAIFDASTAGASLLSRQSGTAWEIINIAYLLGGLFLLYKKIISWHIPLSIISTVFLISFLFYAPGSTAVYGTPYLHLFGSATMIGAFFIATDPVSAATTRSGKLLYGIIIGVSIYAIRVWGSYLDSIAFAVLFGNFCAPVLDYYCRPRIFGHSRGASSSEKLRITEPAGS